MTDALVGSKRLCVPTYIELAPLAIEISQTLISGVASASVAAAITTLVDADALVVCTPVYKAGISGLLKSFVDIVDNDILSGKPTIVGATGGSARHAMVVDTQMRPLFAFMRALTVPTSIFAAPEDWAQPDLMSRISRAAAELAGLAQPGTAKGEIRQVASDRPAHVPRSRTSRAHDSSTGNFAPSRLSLATVDAARRPDRSESDD